MGSQRALNDFSIVHLIEIYLKLHGNVCTYPNILKVNNFYIYDVEKPS